MKYLLQFMIKCSAILVLGFLTFSSVTVAQTSIEDNIQSKTSQREVEGAQLGSLICSDATGKLVLCSGSIEESVSGIATNVPYITLNKPTSPEDSRFIFDALVSADQGAIEVGDFLKANKGGTLVKCTRQESQAYAVALDNASANGRIRVKLLNR